MARVRSTVLLGVTLTLTACSGQPDEPRELQSWLLETIGFFRGLEFFEAIGPQHDGFAMVLSQQHESEWGKPIDPADPIADLLVLRFDNKRVWWEDIEADVAADNEVYVDVLQDWARISRGAFSPSNVRERWESETGPVFVSFELNNQRHDLQPEYVDDYIDLKILLDINRIISKTGVQFELYYAFDQTAFIVALRSDEKRRLVGERGWRFAF